MSGAVLAVVALRDPIWSRSTAGTAARGTLIAGIGTAVAHRLLSTVRASMPGFCHFARTVTYPTDSEK